MAITIPRSLGSFIVLHEYTPIIIHIISYCAWILLIALTIGLFPRIPFRERMFSISDASISQPNHKDTITYTSVLIIVFVVPIGLYFVYAALKWYPIKSNAKLPHWRQAYYWAYSHFTAVISTIILTEFLKPLVQRFRPDFISRCFPDGIPSSLLINNTRYTMTGMLSTNDCTGTDLAFIHDGRVSFLSGHTSTSFAGALFLTYFLYHMHARMTRFPSTTRHDDGHDGNEETQKQLHVLNQGYRDWSNVHPWVTAVSFLPLLFAIFVGGSRCFDNRHHISDVICGAILALFVTTLNIKFNLSNFITNLEPHDEKTTSSAAIPKIHDDEEQKQI